ncbi:tetratricopeptide repeat protein [Treponema sp. HNW]|uniref:periplasmic flagellar collar protein FlcA n=1 Tax=Treponema sp. HNW TaxID=3116654 RepID=UPI003D0E5BA9
MPGIDQLKQFDKDITPVGEELELRKKSGTTLPTFAMPENVPAADDSLDFEFGLPVKEEPQEPGDEASEAGEQTAAPDAAETAVQDTPADSTLPDETPIPSLDDLDPDIAAFLSGTKPLAPKDTPAPEVNEETAADFDMPSSPVGENALDSFDSSGLDGLLAQMEQNESKASEISPDTAGGETFSGFDALSESDDGGFDAPGEGEEKEEEISLSSALDDFESFDDAFAAPSQSLSADDGIQADSAVGDDLSFDLTPPEESDDGFASGSADFPNHSEEFNLNADLSDELNEGFSQTPAMLPQDMQDAAKDFDLDDAFSQALASEESDAEDSFTDDLADADAPEDFPDIPEFDPESTNLDSFEIPGFSDTVTASTAPGAYGAPRKKGTEAEEDFDRTYLNDKEYKLFRENLHSYPLNLRIAIQQLIVKNEFTDAAVMEVMFKVIKKVPARQLAAHLGKMLDTVISVPLNYERRTAEQYELYKKSLEYQLKNRIIPGAIAAVILGIFIYILSYFGYTFVYRPLKAESLYKTGYNLIERDLYAQAETKFNEALTYKVKKHWFFKYARAYREKRQYGRAAVMYEQLIKRFKFDKKAGLEYASMEFEDLANYKRAAEIVRRLILDHHINDKDAMLLLGDIYLEWASVVRDEIEKAEKIEEARLQYSTLISLYGASDIYLGRMLRYFIRTDNLREVLPLKGYFTSSKKVTLPASDLIELGGYLLEKQYGYLPPADEYLRGYIDNVKRILEKGIKADPAIPEGHYNLSRYFVRTGNSEEAKTALTNALTMFAAAKKQSHGRTLKYIDTYRLLGEQYTATNEYLLAEQEFSAGIALFEQKKETIGLQGNKNVGILYSDMADIDYFISGDIQNAFRNYKLAVANGYDTPSIRYRIGFVQYTDGNYAEALGSFIKTASEDPLNRNLLLALGNVLSNRGDESAARSYYERLINILDADKKRFGVVFPQVREDHYSLVDLYLKASNNLGVTLSRLAVQTGNTALQAQAVLYFSESARAWDALTRNQKTMVRLEGSNLAAQNVKYITYPRRMFEPAIYAAIPSVLYGESGLKQYALE